LAADLGQLFSFGWLVRQLLILVSLSNLPIPVHTCSYKSYFKNSYNGCRGRCFQAPKAGVAFRCFGLSLDEPRSPAD
jgi:hypothetical protein